MRAQRREAVPIRIQKVLRSNGPKKNGMFQLLSEQFERCVDIADVDHHLPPDPVVAEGFAIRLERALVARAGGNVVVRLDTELLSGDRLELVEVDHLHDLIAVGWRSDDVGPVTTPASTLPTCLPRSTLPPRLIRLTCWSLRKQQRGEQRRARHERGEVA